MTLSLWQWILLACALAFVTKLLGYSLPERWMRSGDRRDRVRRLTTITCGSSTSRQRTGSSKPRSEPASSGGRKLGNELRIGSGVWRNSFGTWRPRSTAM